MTSSERCTRYISMRRALSEPLRDSEKYSASILALERGGDRISSSLLFVRFRSGTALRVVGSGWGAGDIGWQRDSRIAIRRRCGAAGYIGRGFGPLAS